jgi:ribulose-phosphate 3-epimerase
MDGHFVPNLSMGPGVVSCIRKGSDLPFDVHLMLSEPGRYIEPFAKAGADHITVHVESRGDLADVIRRIHDLGCSAGVTLRPGTPATSLRPYLEMVEMVLVMTVEPGFGGQSFMEGQLPKIASLRKMIDATGKKIYLEVDGGIAVGTARQVKAAGADVLVAGSSVFGSKNGFAAAIKAVREDA